MTFHQKKQIYENDLNPRQREILKQLLKGITQKDIKIIKNPSTGEAFGIDTIKQDIKDIYKILDITKKGGQICLISECYDWFPIIYNVEDLPCQHCFRSPKNSELPLNNQEIII